MPASDGDPNDAILRLRAHLAKVGGVPLWTLIHSPHHRMVYLAKSTLSLRQALPHPFKNATVTLGRKPYWVHFEGHYDTVWGPVVIDGALQVPRDAALDQFASIAA